MCKPSLPRVCVLDEKKDCYCSFWKVWGGGREERGLGMRRFCWLCVWWTGGTREDTLHGTDQWVENLHWR